MNAQQNAFITNVALLIERKYTNVSKDVVTFIACQFALESNYGMSKLAKNHNNYSGMKYALVRPRCSEPIQGSPFASYNNIDYCISDFFLALAYHRVGSWEFETVQRFTNAIKKWYCPEKDYIDKINLIYLQFKSYQNV